MAEEGYTSTLARTSTVDKTQELGDGLDASMGTTATRPPHSSGAEMDGTLAGSWSAETAARWEASSVRHAI